MRPVLRLLEERLALQLATGCSERDSYHPDSQQTQVSSEHFCFALRRGLKAAFDLPTEAVELTVFLRGSTAQDPQKGAGGLCLSARCADEAARLHCGAARG